MTNLQEDVSSQNLACNAAVVVVAQNDDDDDDDNYEHDCDSDELL